MRLKKALSVVLSLSLVCSLMVNVKPAEAKAASYNDNLIANPGFETAEADGSAQGWTLTSASIDTKSPRSGNNDAAVQAGGSITQTMTIPFTGKYNLSGYFQSGGSFGIKSCNTDLGSTSFRPSGPPGSGSTGYTYRHIDDVSLNQGDVVTVYVNGYRSGTTNADDLSLQLDSATIVDNNYIVNGDLSSSSNYWAATSNVSITSGTAILAAGSSEKLSQNVTVPVDGYYTLTATASAQGGDTVIGLGDTTTSVAQGDAASYSVADVQLSAGQSVSAYISSSTGAAAGSFSLKLDLSKVTAGVPSASSVVTDANGSAWVGIAVNGSYNYSDTQNYSEGKTTYQWEVSDTANGTFTAIDGATSQTYAPSSDLVGKYLRFTVTPVDMYKFTGTAVSSDAVKVSLNMISNPSFESGTSKWACSGASVTNSTADVTPTSGTNQALINANSGSSNNRLSQVITVSQSGCYNLSAEVAALGGATIGIRRVDGENIVKKSIDASSSYVSVTSNSVALEKGDQVEVYVNGGTGKTYVDDLNLVYDSSAEVPIFSNIKSFTVDNQIGLSDINYSTKTVTFTMPYGSDVSAVTPTITVSDGATINPTGAQNFESPVTYTVTDKNKNMTDWTVTCKFSAKNVSISSSSSELNEAFSWAVNKALGQVQTGKTGIINADEQGTATSVSKFIPSYWAGYSYRSAFYIRDYVHQANGAHIIGLDKENFSMFKAFLSTASESSGWYPNWSLNFDGSTFKLDHSSDTKFVREVPSVFELVQSAYDQYKWTGNSEYLTDLAMLNYYEKALSTYITEHDTVKVNGVPEGVGTGNDLNLGLASYNEQSSEKVIEAGDDIACEYAAYIAYSEILEAKGDKVNAAVYQKKAADLKNYFNNTWSVASGTTNFVRAYGADGKYYTDFGKEQSWFMLLKGITNPGTRTESYINYMESQLATSSGKPDNIEACTYLPDTYFQWGKNDLAWKWMKYIIENRNVQHVTQKEGANGNYPEVSYTLVNQTVSGLAGIDPEAGSNKVSTVSKLPSDISYLQVNDLAVGSHNITVRHDGATKTTFTHNSGTSNITWEAQFSGNYQTITADGKTLAAKTKTVNGVTYSYVDVSVPVGKTVVAVANFGVSYSAHVQSKGWMSTVYNGSTAGTTGKALRAEAVKMNLTGSVPCGAKITYQTHVQGKGWVSPASNGTVAGTTGKALRLEAVRITLSGLSGYEVQYRAHIQGKNWTSWQTTKNGTAVTSAGIAGTTGKSLRLEAIQVRLVKVS